MEFYRLCTAQNPYFDDAFAIYEQSFPENEQRLPAQQRALMTNPLYHFDVILEDGACAGIILYWEYSGYVYVEHFAISPAMRGKSVGSRALTAFCEGRTLVVLEIDPPVDDISVRRRHFYQRLGFMTNGYMHKHAPYRKRFTPHELVIMTYPRRISENECRIFQRDLIETVTKDAVD